MTKQGLFLTVFLTVLAVVLGYNYFFQPFSRQQLLGMLRPVDLSTTTASPTPAPELDPVQKVMAGLTPAQKVAQLLAAPMTVTAPVASGAASVTASVSAAIVPSAVKELEPGMVTIFGANIDQLQMADVTIQLKQQPDKKITPWIAVDHEGGTVQRLSGFGFTRLPSWKELCQKTPTEVQAQISVSATELRHSGVDVVLGPVIDVGVTGALGSRVCSSDPAKVTAAAQAAQKAYQGVGIIPVLKHFPGIGTVLVDLHKTFASQEVTTPEATVFRTLLDADASVGVQVTHVGVSNQFPDLPCSRSESCVGQLRKLYPNVLIMTDAIDMVAAGHTKEGKSLALSAVAQQAILAGNDVILFGEGVSMADVTVVRDALVREYVANDTFALWVDQSVLRIVQRKMAGQQVTP